MPFGKSDTFDAKKPLSAVFELPSLLSGPGWGSPFAQTHILSNDPPSYHNDEEKKRQFAIELAKNANKANGAFLAACNVFPDDTSAALWANREWINDPLVIKLREEHLKEVETDNGSLDREQFAAKLMSLAEARNIAGTHFIFDDKERVNLLELYAKVRGFTDKSDDGDGKTIINGLTIKLVKAEEVNDNKPKIIDNNTSLEIPNTPQFKVKLVG